MHGTKTTGLPPTKTTGLAHKDDWARPERRLDFRPQRRLDSSRKTTGLVQKDALTVRRGGIKQPPRSQPSCQTFIRRRRPNTSNPSQASDVGSGTTREHATDGPIGKSVGVHHQCHLTIHQQRQNVGVRNRQRRGRQTHAAIGVGVIPATGQRMGYRIGHQLGVITAPRKSIHVHHVDRERRIPRDAAGTRNALREVVQMDARDVIQWIRRLPAIQIKIRQVNLILKRDRDGPVNSSE